MYRTCAGDWCLVVGIWSWVLLVVGELMVSWLLDVGWLNGGRMLTLIGTWWLVVDVVYVMCRVAG